MSTASEPVEMLSTFSSALAPSFMIDPFPNCFSICWIACSIARDFSVTATSCSSRSQKERRRLASHRRRPAHLRFPECLLLPVLFFFALWLHELEGHGLDRLHHAPLLELSLELLLGLLLLVLVLGLASTRRHRSLPVAPAGSSRGRSSIARV